MTSRPFYGVRDYNRFSTNPKICKTCQEPATKDVLFTSGGGITVIHRYCTQCADRVTAEFGGSTAKDL